MKPQTAEAVAESTVSSMPRHCWQLERNAGMAALFLGLSWRQVLEADSTSGGHSRVAGWEGKRVHQRSSSEDIRETLQVCPALSTLHMPL